VRNHWPPACPGNSLDGLSEGDEVAEDAVEDAAVPAQPSLSLVRWRPPDPNRARPCLNLRNNPSPRSSPGPPSSFRGASRTSTPSNSGPEASSRRVASKRNEVSNSRDLRSRPQ